MLLRFGTMASPPMLLHVDTMSHRIGNPIWHLLGEIGFSFASMLHRVLTPALALADPLKMKARRLCRTPLHVLPTDRSGEASGSCMRFGRSYHAELESRGVNNLCRAPSRVQTHGSLRMTNGVHTVQFGRRSKPGRESIACNLCSTAIQEDVYRFPCSTFLVTKAVSKLLSTRLKAAGARGLNFLLLPTSTSQYG